MTSFLEVEARWPDGDKVPGSLLKTAQCLQAERETEAARRTLESLVARFPHSEEARLAQERLARLSDAR
jgi:TolA-binding protein